MTLALRLAGAAFLFGGMLVWWAASAVLVAAAWIALSGVFAVGAHLCRSGRLPHRHGG